MAEAENKELPQVLNEFVGVASKSNVAVIVPLFGYWEDTKQKQLDGKVLSIVLDRLYSRNHSLMLYILGETDRTPKDVAQTLIAKGVAGNLQGVEMPEGSSYAEYIRKGLDVAINESKASYFIIINPWLLIQHGGVDVLIERTNVNDGAKIICGYDVKRDIKPEGFEQYSPQVPKELRGLSFDFCCMTRQSAETFILDTNLKTHQFLERDAWQTAFSKGFEAVSSQRVPIFTFDVDWSDLESREDFADDEQYFITKWKYDPGIEYGKE